MGDRVQSILVKEGDFVTAGQAHMRSTTASRQAARHQQAVCAVAPPAQVTCATAGSSGLVAQRQAAGGRGSLPRSQTLVREGASSDRVDDDRARRSLEAAVVASKHGRSRTSRHHGGAQVPCARGTCQRKPPWRASRTSTTAPSWPRNGRVNRIAQARVISGGGKVLNLVDLSDVYMTFSCRNRGRPAGIGQRVRIVLDAAPLDSGGCLLWRTHSPPRRWKPPASGKR